MYVQYSRKQANTNIAMNIKVFLFCALRCFRPCSCVAISFFISNSSSLIAFRMSLSSFPSVTFSCSSRMPKNERKWIKTCKYPVNSSYSRILSLSSLIVSSIESIFFVRGHVSLNMLKLFIIWTFVMLFSEIFRVFNSQIRKMICVSAKILICNLRIV